MSKKTKQLEVKQSVLDWCNDQVDQGNELKICWDGGGDSGWAYFQINNKETSNEYTEYLTDRMYAELDYGSWAGEFHATGEAIYSKEEQAFVGIDNYSEDDTMNHECVIIVEVPKELWHDSLTINIEANDGDRTHITCTFNIKNGFLSDKHTAFIDGLEDKIEEEVDAVIQDFIDHTGYEYRSIWENIVLELKDAVVKGDFLVYTIDSLGIGTTTGDEKSIYLDITPEEQLPENN
jgi:hypothetical protein